MAEQVTERVAQLKAIPIKNDSVFIESPTEQVPKRKQVFFFVFFFFFFCFFFFFFELFLSFFADCGGKSESF